MRSVGGGTKTFRRWGAASLLVPTFFLPGCVDPTGIESPTVTDSGATTGSGPRIITGRIPGEYEHRDIAGTVATADGCVALELSGGVVYPIIWPLGFQLLPDQTSVGDANGTVYIGEKLTGSRGYLVAREEFEKFSDPAQLTGFDECSPDAETFLVLVNVKDFDTPE
ncbi:MULTISPECIES: hypothetical protein [unclassified Cryobacterium]|uniref:hypothetical protein n=1 Tax=unclassified Cryobacterium TaxID=2649013 RepID=UPI00106B9570|nr:MULTISPECIES: hypothetical protein [unclassified Cryobacterium]TFC54531.1 hypothetical protein E3O68_09310 [Cryobacterium sp. TMB3-1-2]TFC63067.1 hypothetical protein E3O60_00635 [Cryobacterium sp. TMB1-7]TFC70887.1 hypothetical protein E3T21_09320 [Cryobacterium sp. TMB3-15]TFC77340.1 hypothetical protein E3T22_06440 [Cryobacterium sp. TMB3-10]TFD45274.1 hypothetical protein E3T58_03065 [Cryobacterium sp. TMB3-12]